MLLERHNEENVVGIDATVLWREREREAWDGYDRDRFERGGKDIERNDCSVCDDAQYNSGSFHSGSLLVDILVCDCGDCSCGCVLLVRAQGQDHTKMQKVGDLSMKRRHLGRYGPWSDEVLSADGRAGGM